MGGSAASEKELIRATEVCREAGRLRLRLSDMVWNWLRAMEKIRPENMPGMV